MATEWKSQQADGMFYLQFETDNKEKYMIVEKAAQMAIDGKTTADYAEVKHGKWKHTVEKGQVFNHHYWTCSLCGASAFTTGYEKYCHECGAKMDGRSDV